MKECCSLLLLALVLSFYNAITKNLAASVNSLFVRRQWELLNNNLLVHMKFLNGKFQEIIHPMWYLATFSNYTISRGEKNPTCSQTIFICGNVKPGCCQITSLVFSILHSPFFLLRSCSSALVFIISAIMGSWQEYISHRRFTISHRAWPESSNSSARAWALEALQSCGTASRVAQVL